MRIFFSLNRDRRNRRLRVGFKGAFQIAFLSLTSVLLSAKDDTIRILTIGSSFAENATKYLTEIGQSQGISIEVSKAANIGGADLKRHADPYMAFKQNPKDPAGFPYKNREDPNGPNLSLKQALELEDWDFVTLQQFSGDSYKPETYEPYSGQLMEAIRAYAPKVEVLVHQTWAYRTDHPFFDDPNLDQQSMYAGLVEAYNQLADRYGLRTVPVGDAFQTTRSMPEWYFVAPDPQFDYDHPPLRKRPDQAGSLIAGWYWTKDKETGKDVFRQDAKHANVAGCYLGSCVFYEVVTGNNVREVTWQPEGLTDKQASTLRQAAHNAVAARKMEAGFVPMFDGKTLNGWDGDPTYWRMENGVLVGEVTPETTLQRNSFIIWRGGRPADFELKVEYRVTGRGNSGLSYRNIQLDDAPWSLSGYQADIDGAKHDLRVPRRRYTGNLWEERGRRFLAWRGQIVHIDETGEPVVIGSLGDRDELEKVIRENDWNEYHVIARGNILTHILNGQVMTIVIDDDKENRRMEGLIGVQVHIGPSHKIEYRNFRIKEL